MKQINNSLARSTYSINKSKQDLKRILFSPAVTLGYFNYSVKNKHIKILKMK